MKYCYQCGRLTAGEPIFCNHCGRSYDVKLCSRLHVNPRNAEVCSQCGSRELSTPQPRVSLWWKLFAHAIRWLLGILLALASMAVVLAVLNAALHDPQIQSGLLGICILVGLLWFVWSQLPGWFRKVIHKAIQRKERSHER